MYTREWNPSGPRDIGEYHNDFYTKYTLEQYKERFGEEPAKDPTVYYTGATPIWKVSDWSIKEMQKGSSV